MGEGRFEAPLSDQFSDVQGRLEQPAIAFEKNAAAGAIRGDGLEDVDIRSRDGAGPRNDAAVFLAIPDMDPAGLLLVTKRELPSLRASGSGRGRRARWLRP